MYYLDTNKHKQMCLQAIYYNFANQKFKAK